MDILIQTMTVNFSSFRSPSFSIRWVIVPIPVHQYGGGFNEMSLINLSWWLFGGGVEGVALLKE